MVPVKCLQYFGIKLTSIANEADILVVAVVVIVVATAVGYIDVVVPARLLCNPDAIVVAAATDNAVGVKDIATLVVDIDAVVVVVVIVDII